MLGTWSCTRQHSLWSLFHTLRVSNLPGKHDGSYSPAPPALEDGDGDDDDNDGDYDYAPAASMQMEMMMTMILTMLPQHAWKAMATMMMETMTLLQQ
ncbi:hypothetical protein Gogos_007371, partial [Gossypium gossypioides]|nr:hypothetical protein [Gossypium gossypioides]